MFISNSGKYSDIGHAFGYMKASTNLQTVNLFVMPYNYPIVIALLDEYIKVHKYKPPPLWKQKFDNYLKTMPLYYASVRLSIFFEMYMNIQVVRFRLRSI